MEGNIKLKMKGKLVGKIEGKVKGKIKGKMARMRTGEMKGRWRKVEKWKEILNGR